MTSRTSMTVPLPPPFDLDQRPVAAIFRSPLFNASETFVPAQAAALRRYQPLVVGLERKGAVPPALADRLFLLDRPGERLALKLLGRGGGVAERLGCFRPALIHAHFGPDGLLALPIAERLGVPLVTTLHGYDVNRTRSALLGSGRLSWMLYALLQRRLAARGDLFVAVSDALRRRAIARGFPEARTVTHRIGVDLSRFPPGPGGEPAILHVGRLVEKKGTHLLLRAFARVRQALPGATVVIIGDGPRRDRLERLAAGLGLGESVRFLGSQPPERVAEWMRRASALAIPSVTAADGDAEGLPVVLFEAAASGLPVVGSDHEGIPEGVEDGVSGFVVPEGEAEPLARRLIELLATPALAARMGAAARRLAEREFDIVHQTAKLERLYDRARERAR
jgi:glycosyltransferase involved in cell wall biosynthesis